jgi:hypothetical protein
MNDKVSGLPGDPEKTGNVCLEEEDVLLRWTRWIKVAVRISVLVFLPYVLGVSGLTAVPPSSGPHTENRFLAGARALVAPAAVLAAQAGGTGTVLLSPQDTYLNLDAASYAQSATLRIYTWQAQQPGNVAILKFDLSSVPREAVVQRATLRLALIGADPTSDPTYNVSAQKILRKDVVVARATGLTSDGTMTWSPSTCCFNGFPLGQSDLSAPEDVKAVDKTLGYKSWTVTEMVREWLATPSTNRGVMLNADATKSIDRYRDFASMEHSNSSLRPYLEIQFSAADPNPPSVAVTAPAPGTTVSDTVTISANATDPSGVAGVRFQLNGAPIGSELTAAPYTTTLDTTILSDGAFELTAVARDWAGNVATSAGVNITVRNGLLFLPPQDTYLGVDAVNYSNDALLSTYTWPNNKIANAIVMKFDLSSLPQGAMLQEATLHLALVESDNSSSPTYTVTAHKIVGRNPVIAAATGFTFDGVTSWSASECCYNGIPLAQRNISSAYDQRAVDKTSGRKVWTVTRIVEEWLATPASNFGLLLNSDATKAAGRFRRFASMQHSDATLHPYLRLRFVPAPPRNTPAGGGTGPAADGDITPPSVWITAPANGATVQGTVSVNAAASDNVGVASVQFQLDGADLGAPDTTEPFSTSWNTAMVLNGSHTLKAVARDTAGNSKTSSPVTVTVSNAAPPSSTTGIASRYPGDVRIETDSQVVFVERFDESTLSTLFGRWTDVLNGSAMSFSTDVPTGSPLGKSLKISWSSSSVGGHLYRQLTPGVDDTLYVRYYVKFPATGSYSHNGVWMGGYNPALGWPNPQAGIKPTGADRFSAAAEQDSATTRFDHYNYWMGMHQSVGGSYWGNTLLNSPSVSGAAGQWMCVEHMIKLNNPVTASNGEHAIWLNGVKVSHLGQGFPKGTWSGGMFTQNASGTAFGGFRWRSDTRLNLNYIWLQTYAPNTTASQNNMNFAHVVAAKSYIGCLAPATSSPTPAPTSGDTTPPTVSITAPSAASTVSGTTPVTAVAFDNVGLAGVQFKLDGVNLGSEVTATPYSIVWNTTAASNGAHTLTAIARDAAGNTATSAPVSVTVANTTVPGTPSSNEYPGLTPLTDQPWNTMTGLGWSYLRRTSSKDDSIVADPAAPYSPSNTLRIVFTPSMQPNTEPSVHYRAMPPQLKEVYTSWWMKLSPNWTCSPAGCGKVTFLFAGQGYAQAYTGVYHSGNGSGLPPYRIGVNTAWSPYTYEIWYPNATTTPINPGEWYHIEFYYKWETIPGVSGDGIIRWWVNGVLNGNHTTVHYPPSEFVEFQFAPTLQNPPPAEQYMYIDHTRISGR